MRAETDFFLELIKVIQVFFACLLFINVYKASVAVRPHPVFVLSVFYPWYTSISDLVIYTNVPYILSARTVHGVFTAWMIDFFDAITKHQYPFAIFIKIFNFLWEPRDLNCIGRFLFIIATQHVVIICILHMEIIRV